MEGTTYLPKTSSANKGYFPSSSTGGPARTIESQLIHIVIRLYSPWEARNLKMRHFVEAVRRKKLPRARFVLD